LLLERDFQKVEMHFKAAFGALALATALWTPIACVGDYIDAKKVANLSVALPFVGRWRAVEARFIENNRQITLRPLTGDSVFQRLLKDYFKQACDEDLFCRARLLVRTSGGSSEGLLQAAAPVWAIMRELTISPDSSAILAAYTSLDADAVRDLRLQLLNASEFVLNGRSTTISGRLRADSLIVDRFIHTTGGMTINRSDITVVFLRWDDQNNGRGFSGQESRSYTAKEVVPPIRIDPSRPWGTGSPSWSIEVGNRIGPNKRVVEATTKFADRDTFYVSIVTQAFPEGSTLTARWTFEDGQQVDSSSQRVAWATVSVTEFHLVKPDPWPSGRYTVEVWLNGRSLGRREFLVHTSSPATGALYE
jgi:hypothetical protein